MAPTIFRERGYKFFFFSHEETRMHVHAVSEKGEAKVWMEPAIELAMAHSLNVQAQNVILKLVEAHADEIREAWHKHFG